MLAVAASGALADCRSSASTARVEAWHRGTGEQTVTVGGEERSFLLHVPRDRPRTALGGDRAYPLLIVLHGSGADGEAIREQSRMDSLADARRFLVAYPNGSSGMFGIGSDWNAGTCCGAAARGGVDDVAFVQAVISSVERHLPVDTRRVYVAGFSDGGRMAYRVACASARTIAAVGVVSASLVDDRCAPARPVPLIAFHGTSDEDVPYDDSARTPSPAPPVAGSAALPPSVRVWSAIDRCTGLAMARVAPHVTRAVFAPCAADVVFYRIDSAGHAWPGGAQDGKSGDPPPTEISASDVMIRFFFRHQLR